MELEFMQILLLECILLFTKVIIFYVLQTWVKTDS